MRIVRLKGWWAWVGWSVAFTAAALLCLAQKVAGLGFGLVILLSALIGAEIKGALPGLVTAIGVMVFLLSVLGDPALLWGGIAGAAIAGAGALVFARTHARGQTP